MILQMQQIAPFRVKPGKVYRFRRPHRFVDTGGNVHRLCTSSTGGEPTCQARARPRAPKPATKNLQMNRTMDYEVLCSFLDMPVGDAIKILKISAHTMLKIRKQHGLTKWPFDAIKCNAFRMNWTDVAVIRAAQLRRDDLDEDTRGYLEAAERRGWLMRKMYAQKEVNQATESAVQSIAHAAPPDSPELPSEEPIPCLDALWNDSTQEAPAENTALLDDFFLEPSHPDNHAPIQWMYRDDDEEEWGILGHGL